MANIDYLAKLKQGVDIWNQWKKENFSINPTLMEVNLQGANLEGINLQSTYLQRAKLQGANLQGANLNVALLQGANLEGANLEGANLLSADLQEANLQKANLQKTYMARAHLLFANLQGANLQDANLEIANLICANLNNAIITGAKLYGTARDDWKIDGIICDYVYWDNPSYDERVNKPYQRTPKDRNFQPGEFEELYKSLPTFEYYFEHGFTPLDPLIMDNIVQAINERHPEFQLKLDSFHSRGRPHATFTVLEKNAIEDVEHQIKKDYENRMAALEGKQDQLIQLVSILIDQPQQIGDVFLGNKIITAGQDYFEHIDGNNTIQRSGQNIIKGDSINLTCTISI